jgi:hypothetical protein
MDNAINAFYSWRDSNDVLYRLYKVGSKLYAETGASAAQLDTGWPQLEAVVGAVLDNRLVLVSGTRRRTWRGDNSVIESFGVTTPAAPTAALAAGTLTGTYYYAYTEYDPTTGDESGPGILVTPVSPAAQGVTLTLAAVSSDTRFSQRRIYRTTAGGSPPDLFLIDTITSATSYTDSGEVDGTTPVGRIVTSDGDLVEYFTGSPPEDFVGCAVHMNRMLYWYGNKLFWTPEYEPQRWTEADSITTDAPIRAVISVGFRAVVLTTHTVEIVETDFIRDGTGIIIPRRTVVSRDVGAAGPWSPVLVRDDELYWLDRRGIYRLVGDKVVKVSGLIDNLFRYLNTGYAGFISGAYNHIRNQVWWSCPFASIQEDNTRLQTTIVLQPGDSPRWSLFQLEASYVAQFDDDLNGIRFGIIDHLGCFKEMESFEGDGAEGNESTTTEDDDGISSISGNTITVTPSPGWTTNEHRGKAVVCRDVDTGDIFYYLITSNGADSLTVVDTPDSSLESGDGFYLGGMRAFIEIAEQDFGTPNKKRVSRLSTQFDDLTQGRFV